jgi:hypothetical protein
MSEVSDLLNEQLDERRIREIAAHLGTDESQTRDAISAAIPTLIGGMGRSVDTPDGTARMASQMKALGSDNIGDLLGGLLASSKNGSPSSDPFGNHRQRTSPSGLPDLVGDLFGNKQKRVEDAVGKSSGLDMKKIGPLLAILAPLVLGAMRSRASASTRSSGSSTGDLGDMFRRERTSVESRAGGSIIGKLLDQDGDGDFDLSDMLKLGMRFLGGRR